MMNTSHTNDVRRYVICGGKPMIGEVRISGAKNSALGLLAAAIMTDEDVIIENVPDVSDVRTLLNSIKDIGGTVKRLDSHTYSISGRGIPKNSLVIVDGDAIRAMRASYYLVGALLGRGNSAKVALPGGCKIGARPTDLHEAGFRAMGATVDTCSAPYFAAEADKLVGAVVNVKQSVGATINIMMAASLAEGETRIENAAMEPHIVDVANLLNAMGADVKGAGTDTIRVKGVQKLHGINDACSITRYSVIPDQIEAGTFMAMAAATRGDITITNVIPKHLEEISSMLDSMGVSVIESDDSVRVIAKDTVYARNVTTGYYPKFPTDMQPQMTAVLCLAEGTGVVTEAIFDNRFGYASELSRMGANITIEKGLSDSKARVIGVSGLTGRDVNASDLRAGAALVIAALAATGESTVGGINYIERGYEDFDQKIRKLGGDIWVEEFGSGSVYSGATGKCC